MKFKGNSFLQRHVAIPLLTVASFAPALRAQTPGATATAPDSPLPDLRRVSASVPTPEFSSKQPSEPAQASAPASDVPRFRTTLNGKLIPLPEPEPVQLPDGPRIAANTQRSKETAGSEPETLSTDAPAPVVAAAEPQLPVARSGTEVAATDAALVLDTVQIVQDPPAAPSGPVVAPPPSQNATINLVNLLVKRGILSREDAAGLIQQAEEEANVARNQAQVTQYALEQAAAAQAAAIQATPPPPATDGAVRVTYVPEIVRTQIRDEVKRDVLTQAKEEGWANAVKVPKWVSNIHPFGDIRIRFEGDFFPSGNDNTGAFPNFNAINTGAPFDVTGNQFSPQYNVDQDRNRVRLRARFGADITLVNDFSMGFRLATGENNSPVSANQSMGLPYQGQGGNFSKYAIWLDRAFIKYQLIKAEDREVTLLAGRFDNPFFTVSQIQWDDDIGFDGFALQAKYELLPGFTPFMAGGAFPVYNTDFNFSSNQPQKFASEDKWLFAVQGGFDWQITEDLNFKFGTAYYYFYNTEGKLSSPFIPLTQNDAGDTDGSRPSFAQKGNTYMALRNITPDASNDYGTINQWQYFGLATRFENLSLTGKLEYKGFEPVVVSISGEFIKNLAFNKGDIEPIAVNNRGANDDDLSNSIGAFAGGDTAWIIQAQVGSAALAKLWDWQVFAGYRYVESDAVIDGFTDSDFAGGGTNLKGYNLGANLALSPNVYIGVRWMSGQSVAGPPFKEDVLQFDLNGKF